MSKEIQFAPHKDGGGTPFPILDILLPYKDTYNGNILIKKAFARSELSMTHIIEAAKCSTDPIYFIENYCRIISLDEGIIPFKLYDYQKDMIDMYVNNRFSLTLTARQMGKCVRGNTGLNIYNKTTNRYYDNVPVQLFYEYQKAKQSGDKLPDLGQYQRLYITKNP